MKYSHDKPMVMVSGKPNENTLNCGAARVMMPIATLAISSAAMTGMDNSKPSGEHLTPTRPAGVADQWQTVGRDGKHFEAVDQGGQHQVMAIHRHQQQQNQ